MADEDEFVEVTAYQTLGEVAVARSMLESAGIECFVPDQDMIRMAGVFSPVLGIAGYSLQVKTSDLQDATRILQAEWPPLPESGDES